MAIKGVFIYNPTYLDDESCIEWALMPYWTASEAAELSLGLCPNGKKSVVLPEAEAAELGDKVMKRLRTFSRACAVNDLPYECIPGAEEGEYEIVHNPLEFTKWAIRYLPSFPEILIKAVSQREGGANIRSTAPTDSQAGNGTSCSDPEKKLRNNQRHRERCRAVAQMLWDSTPNVTIADMILCNEITKYGCEGKVYGEKIVRSWINDLAPNRDPGRRPALSQEAPKK